MGWCGLLPGTIQHADQHASYQLSIFLWVVGGKRTKVLGCHESVPSGHIAISHSAVLPRELWLPSRAGRFRRPAVLLEKSLYGHPAAAAHWERRLREVLIGLMKTVELTRIPSAFWHSKWRLLIVACVDDILAAGSQWAQDQFWNWFTNEVKCDPPSEIDRFEGRGHKSVSFTNLTLDMRDFAQQCVELYNERSPGQKLRKVNAPFVSEGVVTVADAATKRELSGSAASILMKLLWLARLARPDLSYAISSLATQVASWTRNSDKMLRRLVCYVRSSQDAAKDCSLVMYSDADLGGCPLTARSTTGMMLQIAKVSYILCSYKIPHEPRAAFGARPLQAIVGTARA